MMRIAMVGIIMHNLSSRKEILKIPQAHKGKVSGLCFSPDGGERLLSCGVDRNVKLWAVDGDGTAVSHLLYRPNATVLENRKNSYSYTHHHSIPFLQPLNVFPGKAAFKCVFIHHLSIFVHRAMLILPLSVLCIPLAPSTITALTPSLLPHQILCKYGMKPSRFFVALAKRTQCRCLY
jgi:WD40 repeat protein